jgi:SEL1 protein
MMAWHPGRGAALWAAVALLSCALVVTAVSSDSPPQPNAEKAPDSGVGDDGSPASPGGSHDEPAASAAATADGVPESAAADQASDLAHGTSALFGSLNFSAALALLNASASEGEAEAQHLLGVMHALGLGVPRSEPHAVVNEYFAALGGSVLAQMALGYRHLHGYGVPKQCETALKYYLPVADRVAKAADRTMVLERLRLSDTRSQSIEHDEGRLQYFHHAADHGDHSAQTAMGNFFLYGVGVRKDPARAAHYFRAAASQASVRPRAAMGSVSPRTRAA